MGPQYRKVDVLEAYRSPFTLDTPPVVIPGATSNWPAVSRWSLDYFASHSPMAMIRLEKYDPQSTKPYLEQTARDDHKDVSLSCLKQEFTVGQTCYAVRENNNMFREIPSLIDDLEQFRPFQVNAESYKSLWIGPRGYVTGMHTDPGPTLVLQISGRKRVVLFAPSEAERVYAVNQLDVANRFSNTSLKKVLQPSELKDLAERTGWADVQPFAPDLIRHPLFADAQGLDCVIQPGDALYIPDGWWHAVLGLDLTISVAVEPCIVDAKSQT